MPDSLQTLLLQQSQLYSFHVAIEDIIEFELENLTFATVKLELQGAVTQRPFSVILLMSSVIISFLWTCQYETACRPFTAIASPLRTKGNANWRMLLSHLEKKHCVGLFFFFFFSADRK